ncbi:MAG TPA: FxsA family protein [Marmoricola sp.]|nr:FxsA family protein [Marmoricola sp.]HNO38929.1 FxsA family protein [Marmoricola sp.]
MKKSTSLWWMLLVSFLVVPVLEIYVIIQVGRAIGPWWTILLLISDGILGTWLVKREGVRAWTALRVALQQGRIPTTELADGILVLVGGTLMLAPGFVSDLLALFLVLPFTRPFARVVLTKLIARRLIAVYPNSGAKGAHPPPVAPDVVQGEVLDDG